MITGHCTKRARQPVLGILQNELQLSIAVQIRELNVEPQRKWSQ